MKIRSKALYAYLLEAGVLNGTPEEIDRAKCDYRRLYKRQWKQQRKRPRKEIRMEVTLKQFAVIKGKALELGIPHTTYARRVILSAIGSTNDTANNPRLLKILQIISMAAIASAKSNMPAWQLTEQLTQAENLLVNYLKT